MPDNDCMSYRPSIVSSPGQIITSSPLITTSQQTVRFAQNTLQLPTTINVKLPLSPKIPSVREKQHFRDLSIQGKVKMVVETVRGSVARHSRATYQWCFPDNDRLKGLDKQSIVSEFSSGTTASEILASSRSKKSSSEKKCILAKKEANFRPPFDEQQKCTTIKDRLISTIREPDIWNNDAMDIAVYGIADLLGVMLDIEDVELKTHFQAGRAQDPEKIIRLRRFRPGDVEHYQLIDNNGKIRNVKADGNCLFRAISLDRYGDEENWQRLRQKTADHLNQYWDNYVDFIPQHSAEVTSCESEKTKKFASKVMLPKDYPLSKMMPYLSVTMPIISEMILDHTAASMKNELAELFNPQLSAEHKKSREMKKKFNHLTSHFFSELSQERYQDIRDVINGWAINALSKKRLLRRLRYLKYRLNNEDFDYVALCTSRVKQKDFPAWEVFFNVANKELYYILANTGMTAQQFANFLVLSETVDLIQRVHKRSLLLLDLLMIAPSSDLDDEFIHFNNEFTAKLINILTARFFNKTSQLSLYDNSLLMLPNYDVGEMKNDAYYRVDLDELIRNDIFDARNDVISHRVCRLMVERFYLRVPIVNVYQETIDNSPLVLKRSMINAEERKLYDITSNLPVDKVVQNLICANRGARLNILCKYMQIFPLVLGDTFPVSSVNLKGLPYGERGLSFERINRQFIDNPEVSNRHLKCIALCANRLFREITLTGELNEYVTWLNAFQDDTRALFFHLTPGHENDVYFLADRLDVIAKKIYGHRFYCSDVIRLITDSLKFFPNDIINVDKLAFVIFASPAIINGMLDIFNKIAEGGHHYNPRRDWDQLMETLASDTEYLELLAQRKISSQLNELFKSYVEKIPARRLYCYLSQQGNYWIMKENETGEFMECYSPSGICFKTPPAEGVRGGYLVLRPSTLEIFVCDENTDNSVGIFFLEEDNNLSLLWSVIRMRDNGFNDTPVPNSTYQEFVSGLAMLADQCQTVAEVPGENLNSLA